MALKVVLNKEPYVGMFLEAMQAYHKETFGIIIGKRVKKDKTFFYDSLIQIFAPVKNKPTFTGLKIVGEKLNTVYSAIPTNSIKLLGDFHTHTTITNFGPSPSDEDIEDLKKINSKYYFSFIMQIRPSEAKNTGFIYKNKEIVYITDIYSKKSKNQKKRIKTRLAAFYIDKIKGELKPIKAELEPSKGLNDLMNEDPLDKRTKLKKRKTLENITEAIDPDKKQEY